jgi:hypothetical protein
MPRDGFSDSGRINDFSASTGRSRKTHLERLISLIPVPYYFGWLIIASVFLAASCVVLVQFEGSLRHIDAFLIISIIVALEGAAINWAHNRIRSFTDILINIVDLPKDAIIRSCDGYEAEIFDDRKLIASAFIVIAFVHSSGIDYHAITFNSNISDIIFNILYYFAVYIEGAGLYVMIMTALTVHKIGSLPVQVDAAFSDFHAIGILYSEFTLYAASIYVIWGFFHMIVPPRFSSLEIILWFLGFAIVLFVYFILPQYNIHLMMASAKKEKSELFSSRLRAALDESFEVPSEENAGYLKDMLAVQNQLSQMHEWPFGSYEILHLILIVIIPLVVILLELILGFIK